MAELDRILSEAQETHRQMQEAVRTTSDRTAHDIVRLRTRFATLVAELIGALKADARLQRKPELAQEFESKFSDMRHTLTEHQTTWHSADIDADADGYRRATDALGRGQDDFYTWARSALGGL